MGRVTCRSLHDAATVQAYKTFYEYEARGLVTKVTYPDGLSADMAYSATGSLTRYKDPGGKETHYRYDSLGAITERIDVLGQRIQYLYDGERKLIASCNENGEYHRLEYNKKEPIT